MAARPSDLPVIAAALVVGVAAWASIASVTAWADRNARTELALIELKSSLHALDGLEWRAINRGRIDDALAQQIEQASAHTQVQVRALPPAETDALHLLYHRWSDALQREFALIRTGALAEAIELDESDVDVAFDALSGAIEGRAVAARAEKERARGYAETGIALSMLVAAALVGTLFTLHARVRERHARDMERQARNLERALQELQQAQEHLVQSGKMAALGQLVAGIAHEINTPLGAIRAASGNAMQALRAALAALPALARRLDPALHPAFFALVDGAMAVPELVTTMERRPVQRALAQALAAEGIEDGRAVADMLIDLGVRENVAPLRPLLAHPERDWLLTLAYDLTRLRGNGETILHAVERVGKVVFALKNYARVEHGGTRELVDVHESVETVLDLYRTQIRQGVEVERAFEPVPRVRAHADELVQVWNNLIHNAVQAMNGLGRLRLASEARDGHVVVSVTDSGGGVPPELQARIFEPFFSTKPRGEGTGLGLHIAREIVARHGGRIELASEPGRTTFRVWLPLEPATA